jgi:hypothetical protein
MTVAVFSAVVATVLAGVYYFARLGFRDNSAILVMQTLSLSFFLLFFPSACRVLGRLFRWNGPSTWIGSDAALSLVGLVILPLAGIAGHAAGMNVSPVMVTLGLLMCVAMCLAWLLSGSLGRSVAFLLAAGLFGTWVSGAVWSSGYQNPLYAEALTGGYYLCKDVLVTSSMTSMLRTFDFPSTGLDGLAYCWYHWGGYWFFAQLSDMLRMNTVTFVQLGFPVVFIPFLLSRFLEFAVHAGERFADGTDLPGLRADVPFWVLVCVGWIGFVPTEVAIKMRFGENFPFFSESYSVAMSLSFITLSLSLWLLDPSSKAQRSLTVRDHCLIVLMPLLIAGVGLAKISLMFLLVVGYGYVIVRLGLWRYGTPIVSLAVSVLALPVLVKVTSPAGAGGGFNYIYPLVFFVSNIPFAWKPFFFILYYLWSWVFLTMRLGMLHVITLSDLREAIRNRTVMDAEVIVVTCIVGGAPAYVLPIGGASGLFFMDFQWWLALGLLLAYRKKLRECCSLVLDVRDTEISGLGAIRLDRVMVLILGACIGASVLANGSLAVWRMVYQNLSIRNALVNPSALSESPEALQERLYTRLVRDLKGRNTAGLKGFMDTELRPLVASAQSSLEKARGYTVVRTLQQLAELPLSEKQTTLLFVPRSNEQYWNMVSSCEAVSLMGPSISGMAMLAGLPDPSCKLILGHFGMYPARAAQGVLLEQDEPSLCAAARERGFSKVIVLDAAPQGRVSAKKISCP